MAELIPSPFFRFRTGSGPNGIAADRRKRAAVACCAKKLEQVSRGCPTAAHSGNWQVTYVGGTVILICNFEELRALSTGADLLLDPIGIGSSGAVAAPAEALTQVAMLQPRLTGSISLETLDEQRWVRRAVAAICTLLHERMDEKVLEHHPAHEEAVALYFDYAHAFGVLRRLDAIGVEMTGMIELITGEAPTDEAAKRITFD